MLPIGTHLWRITQILPLHAVEYALAESKTRLGDYHGIYRDWARCIVRSIIQGCWLLQYCTCCVLGLVVCWWFYIPTAVHRYSVQTVQWVPGFAVCIAPVPCVPGCGKIVPAHGLQNLWLFSGHFSWAFVIIQKVLGVLKWSFTKLTCSVILWPCQNDPSWSTLWVCVMQNFGKSNILYLLELCVESLLFDQVAPSLVQDPPDTEKSNLASIFKPPKAIEILMWGQPCGTFNAKLFSSNES